MRRPPNRTFEVNALEVLDEINLALRLLVAVHLPAELKGELLAGRLKDVDKLLAQLAEHNE